MLLFGFQRPDALPLCFRDRPSKLLNPSRYVKKFISIFFDQSLGPESRKTGGSQGTLKLLNSSVRVKSFFDLFLAQTLVPRSRKKTGDSQGTAFITTMALTVKSFFHFFWHCHYDSTFLSRFSRVTPSISGLGAQLHGTMTWALAIVYKTGRIFY